MATLIPITIDTDAGAMADFTSLAAFFADPGFVADRVSADIEYDVVCSASGGDPDTTTLWAQTTGDVDHPMTIRAAAGQEATGVWNTGRYRIYPATQVRVRGNHHVRHRGLQIGCAGSPAGAVRIENVSYDSFFENCHFRQDYAGADAVVETTNGGSAYSQYFKNCFLEATGGASCGFALAAYGGSYRLYCVTMAGVTDTALVSTHYTNTVYLYNVLTDAPAMTGQDGGTLNVNALATCLAGFADWQTGSYVPAAGSDAVDAGSDMSGDMDAVDMAGTERPQGAAWDIGAFEYAAGGNNAATVTIGMDGILASALADTNAANAGTVVAAIEAITLAVAADTNAPNAAAVSLAVEDFDVSISAALEELGLGIHTLLDFEDAADLGHDSSGNGHDWTLAGARQSGDTPTNNFAVLNPVQGDTYAYPRGTLSKGNLSWKASSVTSNWNVFSWLSARFPVYFEVSSDGILYDGFGVMGDQYRTTGAYIVGNFAHAWGFRVEASALDKYTEGSRAAGWYPLPVANGDVICIAVDPINGKMWVGLNGAWIVGNPAEGTSPAMEFTPQGVLPGVSAWISKVADVNFGAAGFAYAPPAGFSALCTGNLPDDAYDTEGSYIGNGNADGPCVVTGCALESVTIGGTTYTNDGAPGAVVMFTSCGFKLLSATQNANGATYNWTGALLYPTKYSNAQ